MSPQLFFSTFLRVRNSQIFFMYATQIRSPGAASSSISCEKWCSWLKVLYFYFYANPITFHTHIQRPGTIFTLTAAQLVMEVSVSEQGITLNTLQGSNNPAVLSNIIGNTIKLDELIKLMRNAACDVFADDDAFCYTETSCEKNFVMEMHVYHCIAYFCSSHNFAWSRWNSQAGSRTAIFLMRELIENRKLVNEVISFWCLLDKIVQGMGTFFK